MKPTKLIQLQYIIALGLALLLPSSLHAVLVTNVYTNSGTFTPPAGVTSISVAVQGGGGAGGAATTTTSARGGGGGGGGCAFTNALPVVPGTGYTVTVGAGGNGGTGAGAAGTNSSFSGAGITTLTGGGGGGGALNTGAGAAGGAGGVAAGSGYKLFNGGAGNTAPNASAGGAGGGGAGTTGAGGAGSGATGGTAGTGSPAGGTGASSPAAANAGLTGGTPGGGGSGGYRGSSGTQNGGAGAAGRITISYNVPSAVKANNTDNLNLTSSWTNAFVPDAANTPVWDSTVTSANTTVLGADTTWAGLQILNPGGLVTINPGNTLTNGTGIDMSAATQDLTILANYMPLTTTHNLTVAANRTLTLSNVLGNIIVSAGGNISGPGTVRIVGTAGAMRELTNSATLLIDGGTVANNGSPLTMGATAGDTVNTIITNGGSLNLNTISGSSINLGFHNTGTNVLTLASGSINVASSTNTSANQIVLGGAANSTAIMNINGGTVTLLPRTLTDGVTGETTLRLGNASGATGILNLNGGTLNVPYIAANASATSTVNFNGTTVVGNKANTTWITGLTTANVQAGGAIFDSSTFAQTIAQPLLHDPALGGADGGLTKLGAGALTLSGISTYTGNTTINAGKLLGVTGGSSASSTVILNSGTATNGVSITDNTKGWTNAAFTASAAGVLEFNFGAVTPSASVSPLQVTGLAAFTATPSVRVVVNSGLALGTYPLMTWGSTSGTPPTTVSITALTAGTSASLDLTGNTLSLVIANGLIVKANNTDDLNLTTSWVGGVAPSSIQTAKWDNTVTAANTTVLGADTAWAALQITDPAGLVTINSGNTLTLGLGGIDMSVATADMTLNCALALVNANVWDVKTGQTLTVGGAVSGAQGITKQGAGTVILSSANSYAGNTTISAGTLKLGASNVIPDGTSKGNVTVTGTLDLNTFSETVNGLSGTGVVDTVAGGTPTLTVGSNDVSSTFGGVLQNTSGTLALAKTGTGTLTLTNANTYSGSTLVSSGILLISHASALGGTANGTVVSSGASLRTLTTLTVSGESLSLSGTGAANGAVNVGGNKILTWDGPVSLAADAKVHADGGSTINFTTNATIALGANNLNIDVNDVACSFAGNISGVGGSLTKTLGATTLTLSGTNTYTGNTFLNTGIIAVSNSPTPLGAGTFVFNGGVRLLIQDSITITNPIFIGTNNGVGGRGLVEAAANAVATLSGPITITNTSLAGGHFYALGSTLIVSGLITSTVPVGVRNGTVILSGGGTGYTNLTLNQGTLKVGALNGIASPVTLNLAASAAGTLDLNGYNQSLVGLFVTVATNAFITNSSATTESTLTLTGTSSYGGKISDGGGVGKLNLTINGGSLTLTNANPYSGITTVSNGTLLVNNLAGSGTGTGAVAVQSGGTIGGTGTIAGVVTNNGTLSPGISIGTLTVNGNLVLNAGSTNTFDVNGSTPANDAVALGAAVTYGGLLKIVPTGTFTNGQTCKLFSGAGATNASNFGSLITIPTISGTSFTFTNGVLTAVVVAGPSGPGTITNSVSGGVLSLSWPAGQGWRLQAQTNNLATGLGTNWVYVTDGSVSSTNITVDATKPTVFYRLTYP